MDSRRTTCSIHFVIRYYIPRRVCFRVRRFPCCAWVLWCQFCSSAIVAQSSKESHCGTMSCKGPKGNNRVNNGVHCYYIYTMEIIHEAGVLLLSVLSSFATPLFCKLSLLFYCRARRLRQPPSTINSPLTAAFSISFFLFNHSRIHHPAQTILLSPLHIHLLLLSYIFCAGRITYSHIPSDPTFYQPIHNVQHCSSPRLPARGGRQCPYLAELRGRSRPLCGTAEMRRRQPSNDRGRARKGGRVGGPGARVDRHHGPTSP